ncbi:hypothetical protein KCU88_g801, partial [Aureobasidium melanogenum]
MVGVPRSKGCRICVQRRVKCDQARPFCELAGAYNSSPASMSYDTDLRIHDEGTKLRKRFGQKDGNGNASDLKSGSASDKPSPSTTGSHSLSSESSPEESWDLISYQDSPGSEEPQGHRGDVILPPHNAFFALLERQFSPEADLSTLELTGVGYDSGSFDFSPQNADAGAEMMLNRAVFSPYIVQEQLLSTFCSAFSGHGGPNVIPSQLRSHTRWLSQLPSFFGTKLLDTTIRAVSLVHLGRLQQEEVLVQESRQSYGKALRLLNQALADQNKGMAAETLSATILLSFYEMLASDSNESWVRHAGGAGALMRIRGAKRHLSGIDRDVYLAYRHTIVIDAFQRDEPCFLAQPEWVEMAQQIHADLRSTAAASDRLDIFDLAEDFYCENVHIPGTFCEARYLDSTRRRMSADDYSSYRASVVERCKQHRANLKSINLKFRATLQRLGLETPTISTDDPVFPLQYVYVNVFVASTHVGYWTIVVLLNLVLRELEKESAPENMGLYLMENREMAREICRSTSYMMTSSFLGPFFIIFALRLCLMVFDPGLERDWVIRKLIQIGDTRMKMASDLLGLDPKMAPQQMQAATAEQTRNWDQGHTSLQS